MVDRRQFFAFLLAAMAAASAPAIAAPSRLAFVLKRWPVQVGAQTNAFAEDARGVIYLVRAVVTAARRVADGCWIWAVEYDDAHKVFAFCNSASLDSWPSWRPRFPRASSTWRWSGGPKGICHGNGS